jgi:hypothetical protein
LLDAEPRPSDNASKRAAIVAKLFVKAYMPD